MDRTTILNRLAESERYRLELNKIRSRDFRYTALIPVYPYVFLAEILAAKVGAFIKEQLN